MAVRPQRVRPRPRERLPYQPLAAETAARRRAIACAASAAGCRETRGRSPCVSSRGSQSTTTPKSSLVADQPADALLERDRRLRHLLVEERIAALRADRVEPRLEQRIVGRRERQLVDDDDAERVALDVDAFPETARAEQHRVARLAEACAAAGRAAPRPARARAPADRCPVVARSSSAPSRNRAMAREQQERAPAAGLDHRQRRARSPRACDRCAARIAEPCGQIEQRLVPEIERALESQRSARARVPRAA